VSHGAEFECDALLHWQPVKLVAHQLGHTPSTSIHDGSRTMRRADGLQTVVQTQRSVGQDTVTIVDRGSSHAHGRARARAPHQTWNMEVTDGRDVVDKDLE